jgi:hypothetical protein
MTERDFAYWIQGYFELIDEIDSSDYHSGLLNVKQVECIQNHINLVKTTPKNPSVFIISVEALLQEDTESLKKVVSAYFEHVIDPKHPYPNLANAAHFGGPQPNSDVKIRC